MSPKRKSPGPALGEQQPGFNQNTVEVNYTAAFVEAQRLYHAFNWSIIPVDPFTKAACLPWKSYQKKRAAPAVFHRWAAYQAFAVITGRVSGVVVLDVDPGGEAALTRMHLPLTAIASTPRGGWHYYFKYPQEITVKSSTHIFGQGSRVDIRAEGGYAVLPGSGGREWLVKP